MDKAKLNLFDGAVSHRRVGNKKHQFEYKYKSAYIEDVFDFNLEKFKCINSKILSFADNYSDMSGKVIDSMKSFIKDKNIEANLCKVNLLRTPNIGFIKSFNPVCFWFLETKEGCKFFIAEVKNTFYEDQIYIVENNGTYGLTKGQFSATNDLESKGKYGDDNLFSPIDLVGIAINLGANVGLNALLDLGLIMKSTYNYIFSNTKFLL